MISRGYLKDVEPKEISWLWRPYIAFGKVTLIQGDTGIGKTSLMVKVMADLSNGLYPPTTYYVSIENGIADTIVPLFNRVGGNNEFVQYQDEMKEHFVLTGDEVRECVRISGAKLIVVDPWQQFLDDASSSDNNAMRAMIRDVQNAAEETGAAVVLCGNYTKAVVRSDMGKGIGASELFNTLRSVLTVKYGDSPSERCMIASKMSFLGKEVTPVRFVQDEDYRISYVFDDEVDELEAGEEVVESASKADLTAAFLADLLKDGPMDSNDVKRAVQASGFSMTTVQRVKDKIVVVERQPNKSSTWMLR